MRIQLCLKRSFLVIYYLLFLGCHDIPRISIVQSLRSYIPPDYDSVNLIPLVDSIEFLLDEDSYNQIRSINYFNQDSNSFISFFDVRSNSVNVYNFSSRQLIKRLELKKLLPDSHIKYTSVDVINFDSIFISNMGRLYLLDSSGAIRQSVECEGGKEAIAVVDNSNPLIVRGNKVYTGVKCNVDYLSLKSLLKWRAMYSFDLKEHSQRLVYQLPDTYMKQIFGDKFLDVSYCQNDKGNIIFSFPADTNIYETNLQKYHVAYLGKSKFQQEAIPAIQGAETKKQNKFKQYALRDSYGPIYYDPYKKRYLRVARQKISSKLYETNKWERQSSFIIFDENFRIIGESKFPAALSYSSVFFTPDGGIYSRVNFKDEYTLHFVRLVYKDSKDSLRQSK
ncbi:DUF4221 family protein [Chitinophaga sp. CF418]|uniref:DUF4221 family protein n=1 Tax=Chitinophaga sp. CF418 TaxID=1855287 RepID=UPI0009156C60|nr:DUF4221 family protein [Chitinophaga sp. CF418]SHM37083.1 protein of unknown function [Chitinophaga sp. CF418]